MKRSASLCGLLAFLLFFAPVASAQETRGSIEGVVKDSSGAVLPGVTVEARNPQGAVTSVVTDGSGQYRFPSLQPGRYSVTATMSGFKKIGFDNVDLLLGHGYLQPAIVNVSSSSSMPSALRQCDGRRRRWLCFGTAPWHRRRHGPGRVLGVDAILEAQVEVLGPRAPLVNGVAARDGTSDERRRGSDS